MSQTNIVMILIDDLVARDLGCFGTSFYETPRLDRFAAEGMRFTNAYASCPVCSPTRASILSGKYPARVGITQFIGGHNEGRLADVPYLHYLPLEEKSIATTLRESEYQTWHVGKWHLGDDAFHPEHHGFDVNIGGCHWGWPQNGYFSPWKIPTLTESSREGEYLTDRLTDEAINLIRNRNDKAPFFLNLSHYAVHIPIQAPEHLVEKYREKARRLRLDQLDPFHLGEPFPCLHKQDQRVIRRLIQSDPVYAAMIENLDWNIGRILDALEAEGLNDNTLVMFTSDNGGLSTAEEAPTCNFPFSEGKGWNYEGGTRVCQIARWPDRIRPGSVCETPVTSTDFYPTFLEAAGLPLMPEQHVDGESMLPLIEEKDGLSRDAIYWHYPHYGNQGGAPAASIVKDNWKLIENFEDGSLELYNLAEDVSERCNRAGEYPARTRELAESLHAWQTEIEAKIPEPNPDYEKKLKRPNVPNNASV